MGGGARAEILCYVLCYYTPADQRHDHRARSVWLRKFASSAALRARRNSSGRRATPPPPSRLTRHLPRRRVLARPSGTPLGSAARASRRQTAAPRRCPDACDPTPWCARATSHAPIARLLRAWPAPRACRGNEPSCLARDASSHRRGQSSTPMSGAATTPPRAGIPRPASDGRARSARRSVNTRRPTHSKHSVCARTSERRLDAQQITGERAAYRESLQCINELAPRHHTDAHARAVCARARAVCARPRAVCARARTARTRTAPYATRAARDAFATQAARHRASCARGASPAFGGGARGGARDTCETSPLARWEMASSS